eukprot:15337562-Heterocapsa_arctica.AAC.1
MHVAAAAVARAERVTGLSKPEPTERELKHMCNALVNGRRKQRAESEFKRSVKSCLNYRLKWNT